MFFQLGLPDTRGAKWVSDPSLTFSPMQLPHTSSVRLSGNTWLLKDSAEGMVDIVKDQTTKIRAWNIRQRSAPRNKKPAAAPQVFLQPADLEKDLQQLEAVLAGKDEIESEDYGGDDETANAKPFGSALLFLAHLHRQGRTEIAAKLFPMALARAPSPMLAMDAAISGIANGRLDQLNKDWISKGDTAAYIKGLEGLGAEFSRGWANRGAAMHLVGRLRQQKPSGKRSPEAAKLASMLKALKPEDLRKLPMNQNWFVAGGDGVPISNLNEISEMGEEVGEVDGEDEAEVQPPASNKNNKKGPLDLLFTEKKKQTAAALAELLDDTTFIRVIKQDHGNSYFSSDSSEEEKMMAAYQQMQRPYELGELAWSLLSEVVPDDYEMENDAAGRKELATEWLKEIASMSDEQLAWQTMKTAGGHYDPSFKNALKFLVENGGEETAAKLEEVFLDPAAWGGNFDGEDTNVVQAYLKRIGSKAPAFGEKLKAVVIQKIEEQHASMLEHSGGMNDEMKKHFETQKQSQLKQLDQVLKPRGLGEMLEELVALKDDEALEIMDAVKTAMAQVSFSEAEKQVYLAAAKSQSAEIRSKLFQAIYFRYSDPSLRENGEPPVVTPPDKATKEAIRTLLQDKSYPLSHDYGLPHPWSIEKSVAFSFAMRRLTENENKQFNLLQLDAPELWDEWQRSYVQAAIDDQPPPPLPDPEKITQSEIEKLIKELAVLPVEEVAAAMKSRTPDQQIAISKYLHNTSEWPPSLKTAAFTINSLVGNALEIIDASKWKGREFNEAVLQEISAAIESAAAQGKALNVCLMKEGCIGGMSLHVEHRTKTFSTANIPEERVDLSSHTKPDALIECRFMGFGTVDYVLPIWRDESLTKRWKDAHFKPMTAEEMIATAPQPRKADERNHPQILHEKVKVALELKKGSGRHFLLTWYSGPIKDSDTSENTAGETISEN